jgi:hypothetical protein
MASARVFDCKTAIVFSSGLRASAAAFLINGEAAYFFILHSLRAKFSPVVFFEQMG